MSAKTILVTGANTGIGYALCKLLATEHGCSVLLGSRTKSKGEKAVADIKALAPKASVELVEIDVSSDESVAAAAAAEALPRPPTARTRSRARQMSCTARPPRAYPPTPHPASRAAAA